MIFSSKCTIKRLVVGDPPKPAGGSQRCPDPPAGFMGGPTEGQGKGGREKGGEGVEGKGRDTPF